MPTGPDLGVFWKGIGFRFVPKRLGVGGVLGVAFWRPYVQLISQSGPKSVETALQREKCEWVENWVD